MRMPSQSAKGLGLDLSAVSIEDLHHLTNVLQVAADVIGAFTCQPRFRDDEKDDGSTTAGALLVHLTERFGEELDLIHNAAKERAALTNDEKQRKFALLAARYVDGVDDPAYCAAEIQNIAYTVRKGGER